MRLVSGIQPSGNITLGNYLGAIKQYIKLQEELKEAEIFIFIADLHALTVPQERQALQKSIKSLAALYLASGLERDRVNLFIQSKIPAHSQLGYIMESTVYVPELQRMTQYKDKIAKQKEGIKASLLTYPALMAADILLYNADLVPIGDDQKQHLELTRTLAERFNNTYGNTFVVPKGYFPKTGARIMSLTEPTKKMSKSEENPKGTIYLLDPINQSKNKIRSAVTDSDTKIYYDKKNKPGISNLLDIYSALKGSSIKELEKQYQNSSYRELKEDLANLLVVVITPIQEKYFQIINSKELTETLNIGKERASLIASRTIAKVYRKLGILR